MLRIVLVHPDIPQNTGNVGRLCVGLNAELHLVHPLGFIIDDRKLKRAGLDYWKDLKLIHHDSLNAFVNYAGNVRKFFFTTKSESIYTEATFHSNDFLIFGCETKGLPQDFLRKNWKSALTIPMFGPIRSLNLATSVGIVAYEAVRQINYAEHANVSKSK